VRYLSVCSGIEAATQAWHPMGWTPVAFSEIEPFPSEVLAHHYPDVPNLGDMTRYREWDLADVDLLVGGTPCQSFSVAGLRAGMADPRGNLALVFLGIADRFRPEWIVWENVPGVLSSNGGRDFGAFLGALAELGYGWAYRVLDAQYVRVDGHPRAVPQRRRRVFVVGCLGDASRARAVLLERQSLSGHPAPRRTAGEGVAGDAAGSPESGGGIGVDMFNGAVTGRVEATLGARGSSQNSSGPTVLSSGQANAELTDNYAPALNCNRDGAPIVFDTAQITSKANYSRPKPGDPRHPLAAGAHAPAVAFRPTGGTHSVEATTECSPSLKVGSPGVMLGMAVRRLTPRECERLQGFPDDHTLIPWKGKPASECPDGHRYRALGNSMAVNVMRWIGRRIEQVNAIPKESP